MFVTSLYLAGNVVSPYCASDLVMITRADDPPEHPFEAEDVVEMTPDKLWAELSSDSWERRQRAHVEILRRGGELPVEACRRLAEIDENDPALMHQSLVGEYLASAQAYAWDNTVVGQLARTSIEASFCDEPLRIQLLARLDAMASP